jgi:hypothetical protein
LTPDADAWQIMYYYKYLINIGCIAAPWTLIVLALVAYNLYFNIKINRYWAGGSPWLIFETVFLIAQGFESVLTVFEIPIWLRSFRVTRWLSVLTSFFSLIPFGIFAWEWIMQLYIYDRSQYELGDLFWNMILGFNVMLHWPIIPINLVIIIKEISMEWWVFL